MRSWGVSVVCVFLAMAGPLPVFAQSADEGDAGAVQVRKFEAQALSQRTGKLIYTVSYVEHWLNGAWTKREMFAQDLEGKRFLERTLLPGKDFRTPKLQMTNTLVDFKVSAEEVGGQVKLTRQLGQNAVEGETFDVHPQLVIPGGVIAMIRSQWDALAAGETKVWRMVAPARLDWFSVQVRSEGKLTVRGREVMRVVLEPDSWLARLIVKGLIFDMDLKTRALAHYAGVGMYSRAGEEPESIELVFPGELPNVPPAAMPLVKDPVPNRD